MTDRRRSWTNPLLAWVRTELTEQGELLLALQEHERCISAGTPQEIAAASRAVTLLIEAEAERRGRLQKLFARVAEELGLPVSVLTLGSVIARLGGGPDAVGERDPLADQLWELRGELRRAAEGVSLQARRVAAVIGVQRAVVRDVLSALLSDENGNPVHSEGTLIDAQA